MNPTPDIERHIDQRIARLARGRRHPTARAELKDHVLQAAEASAETDRITRAHIDAAFAALGDDATIRDTFFPGTPRIPLEHRDLAILVGAAFLVVVGHLIATGDSATCTVADGGTCSATSSGFLTDMLLMAGAPLVLVAVRRWLDARLGIGLAAVYTVFALLRASSALGGEEIFARNVVEALTEVAAAAAMTYVAWRHRTRQRRATA